MSNTSPRYYLWLAIPALTTVSQSCIKLLALSMQDQPFGLAWLMQALHTPYTAGIILCESISFFLWLRILSHTNISKAFPITSLSYCLVLVVSWTYFREPVLTLDIIGSALILCGVWMISAPNTQRSTS